MNCKNYRTCSIIVFILFLFINLGGIFYLNSFCKNTLDNEKSKFCVNNNCANHCDITFSIIISFISSLISYIYIIIKIEYYVLNTRYIRCLLTVQVLLMVGVTINTFMIPINYKTTGTDGTEVNIIIYSSLNLCIFIIHILLEIKQQDYLFYKEISTNPQLYGEL